jgi:hypothetical protein
MIKSLFLSVAFVALLVFSSAGKAITWHSQAADPIKKIARELAKANVYESENGDNSAAKSPQILRYRQLLVTASPQQLTELAKNKNPVVRLYAFKALVNSMKEVPSEIVESFRKDNTLIAVKTGNTIEKKPLHSIASGFLY